MPIKEILIIASNNKTLTTLGDQLLHDGYEVLDARSHPRALQHLAGSHVDAAVIAALDTPHNTLALLADLRAGRVTGADPLIPVLTIGADTQQQAIGHYQAGADIALATGASPALISASLTALGQRDPSQRRQILRAANLTIDTTARTATIDNTPVTLTRTEFDLLTALATHPNRTLTKPQLRQHVYGYQPAVGRALERHAVALRRKLHAAGATPRLQAVHGLGYRLTS